MKNYTYTFMAKGSGPLNIEATSFAEACDILETMATTSEDIKTTKEYFSFEGPGCFYHVLRDDRTSETWTNCGLEIF